MKTNVDVGPLREAFERSGVSRQELALRLGWLKPDGGRVSRALGMTPYDPGHGLPPRLRERITQDRATELARAMGVDPIDVGL
jgi:hypothetical protein